MANQFSIEVGQHGVSDIPGDHGNMQSKLHSSLEEVLEWSEEKLGKSEIIKAKEDFFWKMGKVFHDDECYHERMTFFTDHFLFERSIESKFSSTHMTPYKLWLEDFPHKTLVLSYRHSIFRILRRKTEYLVLLDLLDGSKKTIENQNKNSFWGIERNMIIQGFIFETPSGSCLSGGIIFHPKCSLSTVKKSIRISKKTGAFQESRFLAGTAKIQLKDLRHANISSQNIYTIDALI